MLRFLKLHCARAPKTIIIDTKYYKLAKFAIFLNKTSPWRKTKNTHKTQGLEFAHWFFVSVRAIHSWKRENGSLRSFVMRRPERITHGPSLVKSDRSESVKSLFKTERMSKRANSQPWENISILDLSLHYQHIWIPTEIPVHITLQKIFKIIKNCLCWPPKKVFW